MTTPVVLEHEAIQAGVRRLGAELSAAYDDGVILVGLLKGSVIFLADLVRTMTTHPIVDFLQVTAFAEGTGRVRIAKDLDTDIAGRDVVLVDAVLDTGLTVSYLLQELAGRSPRSLEVCVLVDKTSRRVLPVDARFVGFALDEPYLVGYGLDHEERYRNVPMLAAADPATLAADPDGLVPALYRRG
ncbi:MAG: hypoxanthine phosphoribosyltransferase [Actinomycetia bacterium]|nr:hypoxanthine phosphoribosyltransferase [Actinomycetes bacterium]